MSLSHSQAITQIALYSLCAIRQMTKMYTIVSTASTYSKHEIATTILCRGNSLECHVSDITKIFLVKNTFLRYLPLLTMILRIMGLTCWSATVQCASSWFPLTLQAVLDKSSVLINCALSKHNIRSIVLAQRTQRIYFLPCLHLRRRHLPRPVYVSSAPV